jgi:murein DD-endopeptidase MepM/ murein hydrolase activator NlpD
VPATQPEFPDAVATQMADIFGGDIDFHRDLRKGDRFAVIYESVNHLGRPIRAGRILAAEFVNGGKSYRAAWFADPAGGENSSGYYTADGKNIRKAFLRSPLEFSRITSGFTSARFHPVLQKWRAHKGIDYGAPTGTRVKATGNGTVEYRGRARRLWQSGRPAPSGALHDSVRTPVRIRCRIAQG